MKHNKWLTHLFGACFAFLFAIAAVGCLATGWKLNIASPGKLLLWCGLFSVLSPLLLYFKYGGWVILLLSVRGAFALWQDGGLWEQMQTLVYTVTSHFHAVYKWPVFGMQITEDVDLVLILLAYLTALGTSICICRGRNSLLVLPLPVLAVSVCLITTDTVPDARVLFLLILGIILLLMTDWIRRKNPRQFAPLLLMTGIPAVLALALLFGLNPQETYVNHAAEIQKKAVTWFEQIKTKAEEAASGGFTGNLALEKLNLRNVGPKNDFSYTVMRVTSASDGTVYLRGRDYDTYTGTAWESSGEREEIFTSGGAISGTIQIQTTSARKIFYTPYYTPDSLVLTDGFADNAETSRKYSYSFSANPVNHTGTAPDRSVYTALPDETKAWAKELLHRMDIGGASAQETVHEIEMYVQNSAEYDLSTSAMDSGYTDFARWFLEKSDTGYCVHFATAATVLLRADGIPARYVEGYMVSCRANEKISVSNQDAHAWVEYYDAEAEVWRILETTPADMTSSDEETAENNDETDLIETEVQETEPPETEPSETTPAEPQTKDPESTPAVPEQNGNQQQGSAEENSPVSGTVGSSGLSGNSGNSSSIGGSTGTAAGQKEPFRIPEWLISGLITTLRTALIIILVICVIPAQAYIRMFWKQKRWNSGSPNEKTMNRWRQCRQMARLLKFRLPPELDNLALRAKFSQHTITEDELARFDEFRQHILMYVQDKEWYRRWLYRWIYVLR